MLLLFFLLVSLIGCGLIIGGAVLKQLDSCEHFDRTGDQVVISIWIGLLILINVLLGVSLFTPLSPWVVISLTLLLLVGSLLSRVNRRFIRELAQSPSISTIIGLTGLTLGVAAYCSQVIVWYDSGLYHVQVIKWLSEHGLVPGLALIHSRFGFISSWFVLPASFDHGMLQGRLLSLPGALCLLLLLGHFLAAFVSVVRRHGRRQDLFMIAASLLAIPVIMVWGMPNSPSPDFPVIVLAIVSAWAMLAISGQEGKSRGDEALLNVRMVPLILAAGAASIKLSAAPLVVVAACFYLFSDRMRAGRIAVAGSLILLALAPTAAAGIVTSGCLFYPAPFICLDLPWSLGADLAATESRLIRDYARWGGMLPSAEYATSWNWIMPWLRAEKVSAALILLSLSALAMLVRTRARLTLRQHGYIVALGISGTAFMFYGAPNWRFGLGYMVMLPALAIAVQDKLLRPGAGNLRVTAGLQSLGALGVITGVLVALHIHVLPRPSYRLLDQSVTQKVITSEDNPHFNLLLPPRIWSIGYEREEETGRAFSYANVIIADRVENLVYYRPEQSATCWDTLLPCATGKLKEIKMRKPDKLHGGFTRSQPGKVDTDDM
jgi:hypothetical protein